MSTSEAIDVYMKLSEFVFGEKKFFLQDGYFKTRNLEKAIKDIKMAGCMTRPRRCWTNAMILVKRMNENPNLVD
jgi:hypothetical protein